MKKSFFAAAILTLSFLGLFFISPVKAQEIGVEPEFKAKLYFFYGDGCPHCAKEEEFLKKLLAEEPNFAVAAYEVWGSSENRQLMVKVGEALGVSPTGVPFNVVGRRSSIGYLNDEITGEQLKQILASCLAEKCEDAVGQIIAQTGLGKEDKKIFQSVQNPEPENNLTIPAFQGAPDKLTVPIFGSLDLKTISLPALTVIIGLLDGFNPCAMWILVFLISLLFGMANRTRMWVLGSAFIVVSGLVYFLFMAAWLNLILFLGLVFWIRAGIGLVAIISGGLNLKEFFTNKTAACKVTGSEKRQRIFERLKQITQNKSFWLALGGIMVLAFAVNLVELLCSAGFPAVYTQVLAQANLSRLSYYLYMLGYIFFYMLDDMLVFVIAMITLKTVGLSGKYSHWSNLIGGILMLILGALLIFKPGWLMFG